METNYDANETKFLIDGFTTGFDIGYNGPKYIKAELPTFHLCLVWEMSMSFGPS